MMEKLNEMYFIQNVDAYETHFFVSRQKSKLRKLWIWISRFFTDIPAGSCSNF